MGILATGLEKASKIAVEGQKARQAYLKLQGLHRVSNLRETQAAVRRYNALMFGNPDPKSVEKFLDAHREASSQLQTLYPDPVRYSDNGMKQHLLHLLPADLVVIQDRHSRLFNDPNSTYETVVAEIKDHIHFPSDEAKYSTTSASAHQTTTSRNKSKTCASCKKDGHHVKDCKSEGAAKARMDYYMATHNANKSDNSKTDDKSGKTSQSKDSATTKHFTHNQQWL